MSNLLAKEFVSSSVGQFARLLHAFRECSPEIQSVIVEMCEIIGNEDLPADDRDYAIDVVVEAMFPGLTEDMAHSFDRLLKSPEAIEADRELDAQEQSFADRVRSAMKSKNLNQKQLAEMSGVTQPAISNILNRRCRPHRKTVVRLASALGVAPEELWRDAE